MSTFYVRFTDEEELLVSGFGELRKQLLAAVAAQPSRPLAFTCALLEHTERAAAARVVGRSRRDRSPDDDGRVARAS